MYTGHVRARALFPAIAPIAVAWFFACPAGAGDNVQVVPLCSDSGGNRAWVEIESADERMKATPFIAVGREELGKLLDNPEEKGSLAIPVPRIMRLVERARRALRDFERPAAAAPAGPGAVTGAATEPARRAIGPREATPCQTDSTAPPGKTDTAVLPPDFSYGSATR